MDAIMQTFLERQQTELAELCRLNPCMSCVALTPPPVRQYLVEFRARGLALIDGRVEYVDRGRFLLNVPADYLRGAIHAANVVLFAGPYPPFHPNMVALPGDGEVRGGVCIHLEPAMPLARICRLAYGLWTGQTNMRNAADPLNLRAAEWARNQPKEGVFPFDPRPFQPLPSKSTPGRQLQLRFVEQTRG